MVIYFLLRSFLGPKSTCPASSTALRFRVLTGSGCCSSTALRFRVLTGSGCRSSTALRFRVLTGSDCCSLTTLRFRTLTGSSCRSGDDSGDGSGRRRLCLTGEFASAFATPETASVAVTIASNISPSLAIAGTDPDSDPDPAVACPAL